LESVSNKGEIAVIGDLHSSWDDGDVRYFNGAGYELLLFVGDLGGTVLKDGLRIARSMSRLGTPALVMPGNNDVEHYPQFGAEFTLQRGLIDLMNDSDLAPSSMLRKASGRVYTAGYSSHPLRVGEVDLTILAGRPFAMGGGELSFPEALRTSFGVDSLDESVARLEALVDATQTEHIVFLAHNGPSGVGAEHDAPWGRDFQAEPADWGDRDLEIAVSRARRRHRVLAVVAGHMHWALRGGGNRRWKLEHEGILYLNPARVPRIVDSPSGAVRHHIALTICASGASAEERLVRLDE
jgi:uncharacterized protein (TIGR04168 family)